MIAWVWLHTGGSVLMPMLMHASNNTIAFVWQMFAGPDQLRLWWLWCALWVAAAALVVAATGPALRRASALTNQARRLTWHMRCACACA